MALIYDGESMNMLMLSPIYPFPANTGALVRIANIHEGLCRYHDVTLVCPGRDVYDDFSKNKIIVIPTRRHTWFHKASALFSDKPYHQNLYFEPLMMEKMRTLVAAEKFDLIYAHFIYTLPYLLDVKSIPIIVDQQNVDREYWTRKANSPTASLFMRIFASINTQKTIAFEKKMLKNITGYISVSSEDCQSTKKYAQKKVRHFLVAPNGVDTNHYRPGNYAETPGKLVLGFLGSLDLFINYSAAERLCCRILPLVRSLLPDFAISVLLIGRNPPALIRNLTQKDVSISVTGTVDDVYPYLATVDVLVLPLEEGAGTKLRVLEAMAAGLPIVGSRLAFNGIDGLSDGIHVLYALDDNSFTSQIVELTKNTGKRVDMRQSACKLVQQSYRWDSIVKNLSSDLESLVVNFQEEKNNTRSV
ncbi:MAG: glycosyltransferase [Alphaproteobacteria bacterium]|nr:MAG: glycosyltransferase [Alphaproteobacteria bacterium]